VHTCGVPVSPAAVLSACQVVDSAVRSDRRYAHTSSFRVVLDSQVVYAAHYRGPEWTPPASVDSQPGGKAVYQEEQSYGQGTPEVLGCV
jgi:hypothetical protein